MSAKKRQDGRYQRKVKISAKGEPPKYRYVYGTTIREVEAKKHEVIAQLGIGLDLESNPTVNHAIDRWLEDKETRVRPQTLLNYRSATNIAREHMGDRPVRDITVTDARRLYASLCTEMPVQASRVVRFMSSVWRDEINRATVSRNPWKAVTIIKTEPPVKRFLTEDELAKVESADLTTMERALVSLLRYTGMRKGEVFGLHVEDIDFDARAISVKRTVAAHGMVNDPKTKAGKRTIPMPDRLCEDLKAYLETHLGEGILFPNRNGGYHRDDYVYPVWWRITRKIFDGDPPEDFSPHIFRHTYAHDLVANNVPVLTAMLVLGHDDMKTTIKTYSHFGYKDADTTAVLNVFQTGVK